MFTDIFSVFCQKTLASYKHCFLTKQQTLFLENRKHVFCQTTEQETHHIMSRNTKNIRKRFLKIPVYKHSCLLVGSKKRFLESVNSQKTFFRFGKHTKNVFRLQKTLKNNQKTFFITMCFLSENTVFWQETLFFDRKQCFLRENSVCC